MTFNISPELEGRVAALEEQMKATATVPQRLVSIDERLASVEKRLDLLPFSESGDAKMVGHLTGPQFVGFVRRVNAVADDAEQAYLERLKNASLDETLLIMLDQRLQKAEDAIQKTDATIERVKKALQLPL